MKRITIKIKGKEYPCELTCGAMRRFKKITGKDVSELQDKDIDDLVTLIYCCTASECNAEGVEFGMSLDDFADNLSMAYLSEFNKGMSSQDGLVEKKTKE